MKNILLCGIAVFLLSGCSQPLRTLMDVGAEQKAQQNFIKIEQARFKAVLREARAGHIKNGTARESIVARYGEPVLSNGSYFLYRDPVGFFDSPKVYLDFDEKGALIGARIEERDVRP
jgi:hypothetical protein